MRAIPNERLTLGAIPGEDADVIALMDFALTFDRYKQWGTFEE